MPAKKRTPRAKPPAPRPAAKKTAASRPAAKPEATADPGELMAAVRALERVAEGLHFTHESFTESLLRLPRAEDYEPLTEPMRRLAATLPALVLALEERQSGPASAAPTPAAVSPAPTSGGPAPAVSHPAPPGAPAITKPVPPAVAAPRVSTTVAAAREAVASAHARLSLALGGLPRSEDYTPVARNLRALASVSPSLMAWLEEVPTLTAPLTDAVAGLREAAAELELALELLGKEREAEGPRVKVVVRGAPA